MTISETEATELLPSPAVSRDAAEKVLRYLVFHRSLLGESETSAPLSPLSLDSVDFTEAMR